MLCFRIDRVISGQLSINIIFISFDATVDKAQLRLEEKCKVDNLQTNPCYHNKYRNKWPEIAKKLSLNRKQGRRTELQVKNYWNSKVRTQKRRNKNEQRSFERISKIMDIKYILNI